MAILLGRLGPDEAFADFGANEPGEVYRNPDTRRDRVVAITRHTPPRN
jgi:hypothetical protein